MPGEFPTGEHEARRGMLTVMEAHKHGDQGPGPGFFQLARSQDRDTRNRGAFWFGELREGYRAWQARRGAEA